MVKEYLTNLVLPRDRTKADRVVTMSHHCLLVENILRYKNKTKTRITMAVSAPLALRQLVMEAAHASRNGGHRGETMTLDRVRLGYYWPGMTSDISAFVHRCPLCQRVKAKLPAKAGLLSMPICSTPNQRLHINLYRPLKTSAVGNHYMVVMTDAFTKYVELAAILNKTENQVAKVIFERWFCRFSAPTVMISDQGKEFCNELVNRLCALWDVDEKRTLPYHRQTNSSAELYNRSMRKYITAMTEEYPHMDLEDVLPSMMLSYNCHVHRVMGDSPFFLTFAHDPRLPNLTSRNLGCFMTAVTCRTCTRSQGQRTKQPRRTWRNKETDKRSNTTRSQRTERSGRGTRSSSTTPTRRRESVRNFTSSGKHSQ
jgi:hypothetical protein